MTEQHPIPAVLVGADDVRGLYVARHLARHGVPLIGIVKDRLSPGGWSRLWDRVITANTDSDDVIETLVAMGPDFPEKPVLFPCFDTTVILVARHRDRLEQWYQIMQPDPAIVEMMMNKVAFYRHAIGAGLPLPPTRFLQHRSDVDSAIVDLDFPVVVKPPGSKHPRWQERTHLKAIKAETPAELMSIFEEYASAVDGPLIVQEWVEGGDRHLYACHCSFSRDSTPLVTFTSRKIRQWPPHTGEVSLAEAISSPEVEQIAVDLFASIGFQGIGYVEVKQDECTGEHYIIEPNLRVSGRAAIAEGNGVELVYSMYREALGLAPLAQPVDRRTDGKWMFLRKDLQSAVHYWKVGQLDLGEWVRSVRGVRSTGIWNLRDPGPFVGDIVRGIRLVMSRRERVKRDFRHPLDEMQETGTMGERTEGVNVKASRATTQREAFGAGLELDSISLKIPDCTEITEDLLADMAQIFNRYGVVVIEHDDREDPSGQVVGLKRYLGSTYEHNRADERGIVRMAPLDPSGVYLGATSREHPLHSDGAYDETPPPLLALQCQVPASTGGLSTAVSGKALLDFLRSQDPEAVDALFKTDAMHVARDNQEDTKPVFWESAGRLAMAWRNDETTTFAHDEDVQRAVKLVQEFLSDDRNVLTFLLDRNQILLLDNTALLHGRTSFDQDDERLLNRVNFLGDSDYAREKLVFGFT